MIIECRKSKYFWSNVEKWIIRLVVTEYQLTENSILQLHKQRLPYFSNFTNCKSLNLYSQYKGQNS